MSWRITKFSPEEQAFFVWAKEQITEVLQKRTNMIALDTLYHDLQRSYNALSVAVYSEAIEELVKEGEIVKDYVPLPEDTTTFCAHVSILRRDTTHVVNDS